MDAACEDGPELRSTLSAMLDAGEVRSIGRIEIVDVCESTQDEARRLSADREARGDPERGLLVVAIRQTAGRGRLGRRWSDEFGLGLAATFVFAGERFGNARASLVAGVAARRAVESLAPAAAAGLRWPNDIVVGGPGARQRKIAGVLIERTGGRLFVGIGINVRQRAEHWPEELKGAAASLAEFEASVTRAAAGRELCLAIDSVVDATEEKLAEEWSRCETLVGRHAAFEFNGERFAGHVLGVRPTSAITLALEDGRRVELPALQTSLVHGSVR